jgi:hypothetical protein
VHDTSRGALERVFDLALSVDAHMSSMAGSHERAIAGVTSGHLGLGEEVTWRARHFGASWTMTSRIVELERPALFVDQQVRGRSLDSAMSTASPAWTVGPTVLDAVCFDAPLRPIGKLVERGLRSLTSGA